MTTPTFDLNDPDTRLAVRRYVAVAKNRIRDDLDLLLVLAADLDDATRAVAMDDLADFTSDLAAMVADHPASTN